MELLETTGLSHEIEKLINDSQDFTIIVSPYLKINNRLKPKLSDCFDRNNKNLILYRENKLTNDESKWLVNCPNVTLIPIKNLHAKCYLNEKTALVASMNLYDYSQINNHEIGVKISVDNDEKEMVELLKVVETIIKTDYPNFDYSAYTLSQQEYTMGILYAELVNKYTFPDKHRGNDSTYEYMCTIAAKKHRFSDLDFKLDKSALKRSTPLDAKTYKQLREEIIKNGVRKI